MRLVTLLRSDRELANLLRNSGWMYGLGLFSIGLTFAQQVMTANLLGAADYGRLAVVMSTGALLLLVFDFRTWEAGTRFLTNYWTQQNYEDAARVTTFLLGLDVIMGFIGALLLFALAEPLAGWFLQDGSLYALFQVFAFSLCFRLIGTSLPPTLLRLYNRFDWLSAKSVGYALIRLILMAGAAWMGFGVAGVLVGVLIGEALHTAVILWLVFTAHRRVYPGQPLLRFALPAASGEIWRVLRELWIGATLKGLQLETFVPVLALLTTPAQVGLFRSGMDIASLIQKLIEPLTLVIQPQIARLYEGQNRAALVRYLWQVTGLLLALTLPFTLSLLLLGWWIYPRLLGDDFTDIVMVSNWLVVGLSFPAVFSWLRPTIVVIDGLRPQNWIGLLGFIFALTGLLIVGPQQGALGAALIMALFHISYVVLSYLIFYHWLKHHERAASPSG